MALTPEEQKALEHIAAERRRDAFQRQLQSKLKAPAGPARATKDGWEPVTTTGRIR